MYSGFVIGGKYILINANWVENYTVVKVKKRGSHRKYIATVLSIGNECDSALLTVSDSSFWLCMTLLTFGALPELQTGVTVIGYPFGSKNIFVTACVVSCIEIQQYRHGTSEVRLASTSSD